MKKGDVLKLAKKVEKRLTPLTSKIKIAGSIRRKEPHPVDIDIVLIPKDRGKLELSMAKLGKKKLGGEKKATFKVDGVNIELYYADKSSWGAMLMAYSSERGSAIGLRKVAKEKGFHLNQYGLFKGKKKIAGKTEKEIYAALGRPYKRPENR